MKKLVSYAFVVFVLGFMSSCSRYQMVTLSSNMQKKDTQENVFENDSIKVTYSFNGRNCPVSIRIFNKLPQPLYVDWSKSAAIVGEDKISYWKDQATITVSTEGYTYKIIRNSSVTSTEINGTMVKNDRVSFVPPKSSVSYMPVHLQSSFFELDKKQAKAQVVIGTKFGPTYGTGYSFNADASPFKFRSFLTFSIKDDISLPFYLENTFWVSNIVQTTTSPESMVFTQSNQFYVQKTTGFGMFMGCTFGAVILLGIAALNAK